MDIPIIIDEPQLDQSLIDHVTEQAMAAYKNYHTGKWTLPVGNTCAYMNCTNSRKKNPKLRFFAFPYMKPDIWKQWIKNCGTAQNCCYVNCTKTRKANPRLTFFNFPYLKSEIWKQWIANCGNAYLASIAPENSKSKVLCELHFDKRDLIHAGGRTLLRTNAIPLRFDSPLCDVETDEDIQTIQMIDDKGDRKDEDGNIDLKCEERLSLSDDSTKEVYPLNHDKKKPRIIRKKGKGVKLVPVQPNVVERKNLSVRNDVCVLYTHYTTTGLYINDHDYLVTPYKRNKILINQNDEWLCMCFLCGSKHYADDHVHHMNLHSSTCNVCKANLGTPFMLNMHVRYHTKKCKYCPEKVLYRDLAEHELLHAKEEAEFENFKEKMCRRIRKNLHTDEEPVLISSQNGSEKNFETSSSVELSEISTKQAQEVEKITNIPHDQEEPTQIIPESQQTDNLEDCKEILLKKTEPSADNTVGAVSTSNNIEESKIIVPQKTEPSADNTVGAVSTSNNIEESKVILPEKTEPSADNTVGAVSTSNNIEESKAILPEKTELSADNTVVTVSKMESNESTKDYMKSSPDQLKNTPKKRNKKNSIKTVLTSPNTNDERKTRRKNRSREVEPVEIDERSPRILRSRQIKMVKEERLSPVPDNNSSC